MPACIVSYLGIDGVRHIVELQADSLYEAAALAVGMFRRLGYEPGSVQTLDVEVRSTIVHSIRVQKVHD